MQNMKIRIILNISRALEIDIVDTDKDQEVNVNESVKAALEEVREGLSQGKTLKDIMHPMFGSNSGSQADSSSATTPSAATEDDTDDVQVGCFFMPTFQAMLYFFYLTLYCIITNEHSLIYFYLLEVLISLLHLSFSFCLRILLTIQI